MAIHVVYDYDVTINSVDLSDHVRSCTLSYEAEMLDASRMGLQTRSNLAGMKNWSLEVEFEQDYATGSVDATLFALVGAAAFGVILLPTSAAKGAGNPEYSGNVVLESYNPMAGTIGDLGTCTASFRCAGTLARAVA